MNHQGSLEDLKTMISGCGFKITDVKEQDHGHQIRTREGAIVNWYEAKGTLQFQGKKAPKERLESAFSSYIGGNVDPGGIASNPTPEDPVPQTNSTTANKKVFVVHGHDTHAKEQLELVVHKLGLNPFVLANTGGGGLTIIEALETEIGPKSNQARFGIVLMTPDDIGHTKDDPEAAQPRARQNVVLEMGMLISAIGRSNVAILRKGHLEVPSDAQGILYIPFNDHVKETVPKLVDRLRAAGFVLNPEAITNASS